MFRVVTTAEHIAVMWRGASMLERGVAEASNMGDFWYVNRVLVQPANLRSRGIGGELLERLKAAIAEYGEARVVVTPGGYDESPRQQRFYEQHGFVEEGEEPGLLVWYAPPA